MSKLLPDGDPRQAAVLARGVRYGDNRLICGVHHPSDMVVGRILANAVFGQLSVKPAFIDDLACARTENERARASDRQLTLPPFSAVCTSKEALYKREVATQELCLATADWPVDAADRPKGYPPPAKH